MSTAQLTSKNIRTVNIDFHKKVYNATVLKLDNVNVGITAPAITFETSECSSTVRVCISYRESATLHVSIGGCVDLDILVPSIEEGLTQLGIPDRADHIKLYKSQGMNTDCAVKQADKDIKAWKQFKQDCMDYLEKLVYSSSQSV